MYTTKMDGAGNFLSFPISFVFSLFVMLIELQEWRLVFIEDEIGVDCSRDCRSRDSLGYTNFFSILTLLITFYVYAALGAELDPR